jgi:hypothetical protein
VLYEVLVLCTLALGSSEYFSRAVGAAKAHGRAHQPLDDTPTHQSDGKVRAGMR